MNKIFIQQLLACQPRQPCQRQNVKEVKEVQSKIGQIDQTVQGLLLLIEPEQYWEEANTQRLYTFVGNTNRVLMIVNNGSVRLGLTKGQLGPIEQFRRAVILTEGQITRWWSWNTSKSFPTFSLHLLVLVFWVSTNNRTPHRSERKRRPRTFITYKNFLRADMPYLLDHPKIPLLTCGLELSLIHC